MHKDVVFNHPQCPFYVIANIPLCPFNPSTGATEFWLGTHAHTTGSDQIPVTEDSTLANATLYIGEPSADVKPEVLEARRSVRPPVQPVCEKGDICLRDLRTWHAGMPNESENYRIMLALGYQVIMTFRLISKKTRNFSDGADSNVGTMVPKPYSESEAAAQSRKFLYEAWKFATRGQGRPAAGRQ